MVLISIQHSTRFDCVYVYGRMWLIRRYWLNVDDLNKQNDALLSTEKCCACASHSIHSHNISPSYTQLTHSHTQTHTPKRSFTKFGYRTFVDGKKKTYEEETEHRGKAESDMNETLFVCISAPSSLYQTAFYKSETKSYRPIRMDGSEVFLIFYLIKI